MWGVYVWRGPDVLKNYGTGLVVVVARSEDEAWKKLRTQQFGVYINLWCGGPSYVDSQEEFKDYCEWNDFDPKQKVAPTRYELVDAPVFYLRGSD